MEQGVNFVLLKGKNNIHRKRDKADVIKCQPYEKD